MNWIRSLCIFFLLTAPLLTLKASDLAFNEMLFEITLETAVHNLQVAQDSLVPLKGINAKSFMQNASTHSEELSSREKIFMNQCLNKYNSLFNDNALEIYLFEGYRDHLPEDDVVSGPEQEAFLKTLTAPCPVNKPYVKTCGFRRNQQNKELIQKSIIGLDQKVKIIKLYVISPAYTYSDEINRRSIEQKLITGKTKEKFQNALMHSDIVFYAGHSRKKGGPDFGPAKRKIEDGEFHVDYDWYAKNRPGMKLMTEALAKRESSKKLIYGMFSCDSLESFSNDIRMKTKAKISTILSSRVTENRESQKAILTTLNALFNFSCDSQLGLKGQPFSTSEMF